MQGAFGGRDDSDTLMDGPAQLGIVRKAASCINDAVLTCMPVPNHLLVPGSLPTAVHALVA